MRKPEPAKPKFDFDEDLAKFTDRQSEAVRYLDRVFLNPPVTPVKFLLYGGALGGGKSYFLRWVLLRLLMMWFMQKGLKGVQVMLACEDYPSLKDRQLSKISREFPAWLGKMYTDHKDYGRCFMLAPEYGSGVLCFRNLDDPSKYQCYSRDTEVLVKGRGFVPIWDISVGEECFSMNPGTREMEWQPVTDFHSYKHHGKMLSYFSRFGPSYCVTENHKMLFRSRRKPGLRFCEARDLYVDHLIPRVGSWKGEWPDHVIVNFTKSRNRGCDLTATPEDFMKFLGLFLAEGALWLPRWQITISQSNGANHKEIARILDSIGANWSYSGKNYTFNNMKLCQYLHQFGLSHEKYIPKEMKDLSPQYLQYLFDGLMLGDGSSYSDRKHVYATNSRKLRDDMMEISIKLGYVPTVYTYPEGWADFPTGRHWCRERYHISITKRNVDTNCTKPTPIDYNGMVYCPTVPPYHNILIRHKGRVMFCGQSSEWAAIGVDELTKNDVETFTHLRMRLRWPGLKDEECPFIGATNPGGIGHNYCKALWMDKNFPIEFQKPIDYRAMFAYVPSKAEDNPHLDAAYWQMLGTLPPHLRGAFKDGSWDVFVGQAFQEWSRTYHVLEPSVPLVPEGRPIYMTFDWGFGKPFSIGWWWIDSDGRKYRFNEWYGWNGTPDQGLRLTDSEIAEGIIKREQAMGFTITQGTSPKVINPQITRLCDPTCFNKKPDYKGGGQGPATAEIFMNMGLQMRPGDPSRVLKWRQFHEHLRVPRDTDGKVNGVPMVQIYSNCIHFIRTVPGLIVDPNNIEDVESSGEDHCGDEAALLFMHRPVTQLPVKEEKKVPPKDITEIAALEREQIWAEVRESEERDSLEGMFY